MERSAFKSGNHGQVIKAPGDYWAYVPAALPPSIPLDWRLGTLMSDAAHEVSELGSLARNLPNPHLLIQPFVRREAVLSSRIEGTRSSLSDLLLFEAGDAGHGETADVREVHNYVTALEYSLRKLESLPVSLRLIREIHARLMQGVRGSYATPGEFRTSQNWIGPSGCTLKTATYVPPPVPEMKEALSDLEHYIHASRELPFLVRLALIHYQFEAIHPFVDGNGRMGRLLITLLLCAEGLLPQPLLYLSAYFEANRDTYYRLLLAVSQEGAWREWLDYFLTGVIEQSADAVRRSGELLDLLEEYREWARGAGSSQLLLGMVDQLFITPAFRVDQMVGSLGRTPPAVRAQVDRMLAHGIIRQATSTHRARIFVAPRVIEVLHAP